MGNLLNDVRYTLRGFARRPLFAIVVVITLALGLSVNAAIFSVYDQLLLRQLPVEEPGELVNFAAPGFKQGSTSCNGGGTCDEIFSYPMFRDLEQFDGPFVGVAAHRYFDANLAFERETSSGKVTMVSGSYFPLLGVRPAVGRLLDASDDRAEAANTVVLTHAYWESAYGADPGVVGRDLVVNGKPLTIVGVASAGFHGTTVGERTLAFVPITFRWLTSPDAFPQHSDRKAYWAYLFARLKPGVSLEQAAAAVDARHRAIVNELDAPLLTGVTEQQLAEFRARRLVLSPGERGQSRIDDNSRAPLTVLMAATALVLLIACVNVANLFLARGSTRVGEMAVRASLGASRARLFTLLLVEVLLLAGAAALLSAPLTLAALHGIRALLPAFATGAFDWTLDSNVVTATLALALGSTLVFGVIPALKLLRSEASPALQTQSTRQTGGKAAAQFRTTLTTAQIALSMALLVLAGWFAQSLANVLREDLGFRAESLAVFSIFPDRNGYSPSQSAELFARLEDDLAAIPGVSAAAAAVVPLLDNSDWYTGVSVEGYDAAPGAVTTVSRNFVSADFFRTVQMPLLLGSSFSRGMRADRPTVVVVNRRFVEQFGLGDAAIGKRIGFGQSDAPLDVEIVGVVSDAKYSEVRREVPPQVFTPWEQAPLLGSTSFYLRSGLGTLELRSAVAQVLERHDPTLPLIGFRSVTEQARENVFLDRFMSTLAGALAVIATVLAAIGIYGVLSYGVNQRLREIGLRMALGAAPQNVRGLVLKQVAAMAAVGIVGGVGIALLVGQIGRALLFGLAPTDPLVPAAAVLVLGAVVLASAYWPARRAAHIDPVTALRGD